MNHATRPLLPPGPPTPWRGLPLLYRMSRDYLGFVGELQRMYGDLTFMRLGPEQAWDVFHPDLVRAALVDQAEHLIRWERGIAVFAQALGENVLVAEGATWQRQRRMLMPGFAPKRVHGYGALMIKAARAALDEAVPSGQLAATVDVAAIMTKLTMDVMLRTLFSQTANDHSRDAARATQILSRIAMREMFWPMTLPDWLPLPGKRDKRWALRTLRTLIDTQIAHRLNLATESAPQDDLLAMLLAVRDADTGAGLARDEVRDQCAVMFQAGHETSATALLWWAALMAAHPDAQERVRAEVDRVLDGRDPSPEDLPALDLLGAGLKEALRLYPPIGALMSRRVVRPLRLGDWTVPVGALLRITPWVIQRDPRWYPQPDAFVPERFCADAPTPPRGAWLPFGTGPRVCIGQHFAMLEMSLVAALLLQRFVLRLAPGEALPEADFNVTVRPRTPLRMQWARRTVQT